MRLGNLAGRHRWNMASKGMLLYGVKLTRGGIQENRVIATLIKKSFPILLYSAAVSIIKFIIFHISQIAAL